MNNDRHMETARRFGVLSDCERLERELLEIPGVTSVEFDLDGFYDNIGQVIFLIGYDIDVSDPDYYDKRREMLKAVIICAYENGLARTEDSIEDYGEHYYFVRRILNGWGVNNA